MLRHRSDGKRSFAPPASTHGPPCGRLPYLGSLLPNGHGLSLHARDGIDDNDGGIKDTAPNHVSAHPNGVRNGDPIGRGSAGKMQTAPPTAGSAQPPW
jgi:hypothetical protein